MIDILDHRSRVLVRYQYVNRHVRKHLGQKFMANMTYAPPRSRLGHFFRICYALCISGFTGSTGLGFMGGYVFMLWALGQFRVFRLAQNYQIRGAARRGGRGGQAGRV